MTQSRAGAQPGQHTASATERRPNEVSDVGLHYLSSLTELPSWLTRASLAQYFHEKMEPYNDTLADVGRALDYAFVPGRGQGGYLVLATRGQQLVGALLMLHTGMGGYVPENILLFVFVDPSLRGRGVGQRIIDLALSKCTGSVKLHVELDNPARRLYERMGFVNKYAEMRLVRA